VRPHWFPKMSGVIFLCFTERDRRFIHPTHPGLPDPSYSSQLGQSIADRPPQNLASVGRPTIRLHASTRDCTRFTRMRVFSDLSTKSEACWGFLS